MAEIHPYLANTKKGITPINDYAGAADDKAAVQLLIDSIQPSSTTEYRGALGDMHAHAHAQLQVELDALYAAVT